MIPIVLFALAYLLGILWGLYSNCIVPFCLILCIALIKQKWKVIIISIVLLAIGYTYTSFKIKNYDYKYNSRQYLYRIENYIRFNRKRK